MVTHLGQLQNFVSLMQWLPTFFSSLPTFDVTNPQLPTIICYRPQLCQSVKCKNMIHASAGSGEARNFKRGGRHNFHIFSRVFFFGRTNFKLLEKQGKL